MSIIEFDPPVRAIEFYYSRWTDTAAWWNGQINFSTDSMPAHALTEGLFTVDRVTLYANGSYPNVDGWTHAQLSSPWGDDRIRWLWFDGMVWIDDLKITRGVPPGIECTPNPVTRADQASCSIVETVDSVSEWTFEGFNAGGDLLSASSSSTSLTWSGDAVLSGTVTASVVVSGSPAITYGFLTVQDRSDLNLWKWPPDSFKFFPQQGEECLLYVPVTLPLSAAMINAQNTPLGRCGAPIDPSIEDFPEDGFDSDQVVDGGPNSGFWFVTRPRYSMRRGSSINPYWEAQSDSTHTITKKPLKQPCIDNDPLINEGDPVIVNWFRYNAVCQQDSLNVSAFLTALWNHEGDGTSSSGPQPNGHASRFKLAVENEANDPYKAVESLVSDTNLNLTEGVKEVIRAANADIFAFADSHAYVNNNGFGVDGDCGLIFLWHTGQKKFKLFETEDSDGNCI